MKVPGAWQCGFCRSCDVCHKDQPGVALLSCSNCDAVQHATCAGSSTPANMDSDSRWLCDSCVKCENCGAREPGPPGSGMCVILGIIKGKRDFERQLRTGLKCAARLTSNHATSFDLPALLCPRSALVVHAISQAASFLLIIISVHLFSFTFSLPPPLPLRVWMCDYRLCHPCGNNKLKGNYCPICAKVWSHGLGKKNPLAHHTKRKNTRPSLSLLFPSPSKVYADNNFDIVMVQCEACLRWLHAECDGIDQEMYELMTTMTDVPYYCPDCRPQDSAVRCFQHHDGPSI